VSGTGTVHVSTPAPGVVLLELDNPPVNAMSATMLEITHDTLTRVQSNNAVRAIVLTGRGRAFCTGADLKEAAADHAGPSGRRRTSGFGAVYRDISTSRAPVIGAINGLCIGGGLELALCCDIRIASTAARFTGAGVNMGLMASSYRLPRLIGVSRAKAMLLTGLPHDAATAERWGLVTALHEPDDLLPEAIRLAARVASRAPLSVEATKRTIDRALDLSPTDADAMAADELTVLVASHDHREAVAAFAAKRPPDFTRS